jgi:hypothetical protein
MKHLLVEKCSISLRQRKDARGKKLQGYVPAPAGELPGEKIGVSRSAAAPPGRRRAAIKT